MQSRSVGRGANYTRKRAATERALSVLYRGDWPARVWSKVPGATRVRTVRLTRAVLPPASAPVRVGFASDLHIGPTTPRETLDRAFGILRNARLDILALGGDYVFLHAGESTAERLFELAASVPAKLKIAVMGNHDLWTDHYRLEAALRRAGVRILTNDAVLLPDDPRCALVGIDDPWTGAPDAEKAFRRAEELTARPVLMVAHAPEALPLIRQRCPLLLVGHTHGGHLALPGQRPVVVPGPVSRKYPHGACNTELGTEIIVSRGVGGIEVPIRTYAPPDVVILDLVAGK